MVPSGIMKLLPRVFALFLAAGVLLALPAQISAKGKGTQKKPEPVVHDAVSVVTDNSITVAGKKESRTYTITRFTEIIVNGQRATAKAIEVGMSVSVGADSSGVATLINAHTAPKSKK